MIWKGDVYKRQVQNASNSGVGRCIIQLAREMGVKTVNFVRRPDEDVYKRQCLSRPPCAILFLRSFRKT